MTERVDAAQILALLYDRPQGRATISGMRRVLHWPARRFHQAFGVLQSAGLIEAADNRLAIREEWIAEALPQLIQRVIDYNNPHQESTSGKVDEGPATARGE